ncbi:uncharacterized protein LOC130054927 [Ostrea edulis]|uniref:uncharacterized protein LOC130054927 n=1 Tax=Ostrea edulis TaxID=37623 RepID=UPI0024AF5B38|nr:uncharacterized protein LOC130054927 [Ostrea edulis]
MEYEKIVRDFIDSLNTEIQLNCSAFKNRFSMSHIHTLFGTLESLTRHKKYLTFDMVPTVITMTSSLLDCTWGQLTTTDTHTSAVLETIDGIAKRKNDTILLTLK